MNKGIIMEVKKSYAIALNDKGIMEKIMCKDGMKVGQKIFYFEEDIIRDTKKSIYKYNNFFKSFGAVAALLLIVFTFFNIGGTQTAYAVVSLDINPSIQIETNSNLKIIKVQGVNNDGKNIDFSDVKNISLEEGIQKIKEKLIENKYLDDSEDVLVGYAFLKNEDNSQYEKDIKDVIQATFNSEKVTYVKGDKDDVNEAKEKGISLGRYEASLKVDESTKNKIDIAPVKEITESIKDKADVTQWNSEDEINNETKSDSNSESNKNSNSDVDVNSNDKSTTTTNGKPSKENAADNSNINSNTDKIENGENGKENEAVLDLKPEKPVEDEKNNEKENNKPSKDNSIDLVPNNGATDKNSTSSSDKESNSSNENNTTIIEPSKSGENNTGNK